MADKLNLTQSNKYRDTIHRLIPGGAHTYSKGDDQFPLLSPAAISRGKGCKIWDVDGNEYLDCSMGLTSVSLGHAYEPVLERVKQTLDIGVNFQRPAAIEKEMAEAFLSLVPCHDMIKFAKNGSAVTTAAMKLARAHTGRKLIAFPEDHPFYSYDDWFIGHTACDRGVPKEITELSVTFKSYDLDSLKALFEKYPGQIAGIITEPEKFEPLPDNYLKDAIELTHEHGAIFITDEMVTGFKTAFPGSISKYGIEPDLTTWGKGIANGFSFCAMTGKKAVMDLGGITNEGEEKVFLISTTHGGETHALAAGLATIEQFKQHNVVEHNHSIGDYLISSAKAAIVDAGLSDNIQLIECNWMPVFMFKDKNGEVCNGMRTLMLQEMIQRGVLFQGAFVPCFSHSRADIDFFVNAMKDSFDIYKKALSEGYQAYLVGEPTKPVFRKYL